MVVLPISQTDFLEGYRALLFELVRLDHGDRIIRWANSLTKNPFLAPVELGDGPSESAWRARFEVLMTTAGDALPSCALQALEAQRDVLSEAGLRFTSSRSYYTYQQQQQPAWERQLRGEQQQQQ